MIVELMRGAWGIDAQGDAYDHTERVQFDAVRNTGRMFTHADGELTVERTVYTLTGGRTVTQVIKYGPDRSKCVAYIERGKGARLGRGRPVA